MASIYREFLVKPSPGETWSAIRNVGAVHTHLAKGFVTNVELDGNVRTVTFANGYVAREMILSIDEQNRRLSYSSVGGRLSHHNSSFQVFENDQSGSRILWITDFSRKKWRRRLREWWIKV